LLVVENRPARRRIVTLLAATALFCLPIGVWYFVVLWRGAEAPGGSSSSGLSLGMAAAAIIAFEMLLLFRKWLRGYRLGRAHSWMFWHVWLGLLSLPLAVCHTGFRLGGPLPALLLGLFLLVIISGIWGLTLQQILPQRLLDAFPAETIESQIDQVMQYHLENAGSAFESAGPDDPRRRFLAEEVEQYLKHGKRSRSALVSASRAEQLFAEMLSRFPGEESALARLRELCAVRRVYDEQARIHWWLHNWLWVHVPLSVLLCALLALHIITALKYW
jgi:hypothetical protein